MSSSTNTRFPSTSRAPYDEASGIVDPRVWTAERDRDMWAELNS